MTITVIKILVIVGLTHGLRWLSQKAGPRWGGLIAGLPSTTAVVLFFLACENGEEYATRAAESGALGLCAGSALALAFTWAVANGRSIAFALAAAGTTFLGVATLSPLLFSLPVPLSLLLVVTGSCTLAVMAQRMPSSELTRPAGARHASWRGVILRTIVPAACVLSVTMLSQHLGTVGAGLLGTFPCMLTSMLVVTSLEEGAGVASRLAQSFPMGQLSTLSFVILFGQLCPSMGVTVALLVGYLSALVTLGVLEGCRRIQFRCELGFSTHAKNMGATIPASN
ncbi:MAG: hypothetical protein U0796_13120 [Gemmatales bacterium]